MTAQYESKGLARKFGWRFARRVAAACVIAVCASSVLLGGCSKQPRQKRIRIGYVLPDLSNPFIAGLRDGAVIEARKRNIDVLVKGSNDSAQQTNAFLAYVGARVDAIAVDAIDSHAIVPAILKANAAGIPVIAIQSRPAAGTLATFVAAGTFEGGTYIGDAIVEFCKGRSACKVGILQGILADESGAAEERGMRSVVAAYPNVRIVSAQPTNFDPAKALNVATDMLTANPDIAYLYSWWDQGALAALEAVRAKGLMGKVGISGFGGNCLNLAEVIKGNIYQETVFFPEYMGSLMVTSAFSALRGNSLRALTSAPIVTVTASYANAILSGQASGPRGLRLEEKLQVARSGKCSQ